MNILKKSKTMKFWAVVFLAALLTSAMPAGAAAALRAPLRGADVQNNLSEMQYRYARYFMVLKSQVLSAQSVDYVKAQQDIEMYHDFAMMMINLVDGSKDIAGILTKSKNVSKLAAAAKALAGSPNSKLHKNLFSKCASRLELEVALSLSALFIENLIQDYPGLGTVSYFKNFTDALASDDTAQLVAQYEELLKSGWGGVAFTVTVEVVKAMELVVMNGDLDTILKNKIFRNNLKLVTKSAKIGQLIKLGPSFWVLSALKITTEMASAALLAQNRSALNGKLLAIEFLTYYFVTYGGDADAFFSDLGLSGNNRTIEKAFLKFKDCKNENGQIFQDIYEYSYFDYMKDLFIAGNIYDNNAIALIRSFFTGSMLSLRAGYSWPDQESVHYISLLDHVQITFSLDPLLVNEYNIGDINFTQRNASFNNPSTPAPGAAVNLITSVPGKQYYDVRYSLQDLNGNFIAEINHTLSDYIFIPSARVSAKEMSISGLARINTENAGNATITFDYGVPAEFLSYTLDGQPHPMANDNNMTIRAMLYDDQGREVSATSQINVSGATPFTIKLGNLSSLIDAIINGLNYRLNYKVHIRIFDPRVIGMVEKQYDLVFDQTNTQIASEFQFPYFELQVADKSVAAFNADDQSFYGTEGQKMRLFMRNDANLPNFSGLTLPITMFLFQVDGPERPVPGAHPNPDDGSIEFTIPVTGRYRLYALLSMNGDVKNPVVNNNLVVSEGAVTSGGGGGGDIPGGTVQLPQTGQTTCWDASGNAISCAGTGQDGEKRAGAAWPNPRFSDNGDQTMTDNLTGLIWTKDGNAPGPQACGPGTTKTWQGALDYVACLNSNTYLNRSDWRLPNRKELKSLVNRQQSNSATWLNGQGFSNVQSYWYWSSSTSAYSTYYAWFVYMNDGYVNNYDKSSNGYVWPVRGGQ